MKRCKGSSIEEVELERRCCLAVKPNMCVRVQGEALGICEWLLRNATLFIHGQSGLGMDASSSCMKFDMFRYSSSLQTKLVPY